MSEKSQISSYQTDQIIDTLDTQDRACSELCALADLIRRRNRLVRAHLAAHSGEIDFDRVFTGERRG